MGSDVTGAVDLFASEQVITCRDDDVGLRAVIAIDDTTLGPGFGGVRYRPYASTGEAVQEAQRLAAAMTLKHACADLPYGGAKSVVLDGGAPPQGREALFARFGAFVARTAGSYVPGVDMGTTAAEMQLIRQSGARAFCADSDPSAWTARGVYAAMRAAVAHALDATSVAGLRVAVQGVGHVGEALARLVAADGGRLVLSDVDGDRASRLAAELDAEVAGPAEIITIPCDVLAPCAVARVIDLPTVPRLGARVVAGAANDTLDGPEVASALQAAGITYVPDFVANAGGVVQVHAQERGHDEETLVAAIEAIGTRTALFLRRAEESGESPVTAALGYARERLAGTRDPAAATSQGGRR